MSDDIDFVEYLRLWASPDWDNQAVQDLHKAADEIERLRAEVAYLKTPCPRCDYEESDG